MEEDVKKRVSVSRQPPIHISLDFETALGGLLKVNPKQPTESIRRKPAVLKRGAVNKGKKNRNNQAQG